MSVFEEPTFLLLQSEKVSYERFRAWLFLNKEAFTLSRWLLSGGVCVTLTDDSDTPTFYQTLAGVTHCEFLFSFRPNSTSEINESSKVSAGSFPAASSSHHRQPNACWEMTDRLDLSPPFSPPLF